MATFEAQSLPVHAHPMMASLGDFEPLRRAEQVLLQAAASGDIAKVGLRVPSSPAANFTVRGSFLAFLARGGAPLEGRRIQMLGAWVEGPVDLCAAVVPASLWFYRCVFDTAPMLDGARILGGVAMPDCRLAGLQATACDVAGDFALNAGSVVAGEVNLSRATVGGDLQCTRLHLRGNGEAAASEPRLPFMADGLRVAGSVNIGQGFEALGEVRFVGARIGGDLRAGRASLSGDVDASGTRLDALNLDCICVMGSVLLDTGFVAAGRVSAQLARIEGDLDCTGAAFDVVGDAAWGGGSALRLDRARIGGTLVLRNLKDPLNGASLAGTRVGVLADDASAWGDRLVLDGFKYSRFARGSSSNPLFRLDWLGLQQASHLGSDFRPGPWRRLIKVLRRDGHDGDARRVAVRREMHLRRIGRVGASAPSGWRWLPRLCHDLFGLFAGYGYQPGRIVAWMAAVWLVCAFVYWNAAEQGVMAPTNAALLGDARYAHCGAVTPKVRAASLGKAQLGNWTQCAELPAEMPGFNAWVYSLDLLLPGVDLRQQAEWAAAASAAPLSGSEDGWVSEYRGLATRMLAGFETLFGWAACLLLLAVLTGLTERDRRR